MKKYFIHNFAKEDTSDSTVCYIDYEEYKKMCKSLNERGIEYTTWTEM